MNFVHRVIQKIQFDSSRMFDSGLSVQYRIMSIISYSAAVANSIGFLANLFLYNMSFPTAFCGICAALVFIYLLFFLHTEHYLWAGFSLLFILIVFEFPLLVFAYGSVMYPYLVLGFMSTVMLTSGKKRWVSCILLGIFYLAIIVISQLHPFLFGEQEAAGLLGSALVTFSVALIALTFCMVTWQTVYLKNTVDTDSITGKLSRVGFFRMAGKMLRNAPTNRYAVLCFDVRSFKAINTIYGTEEGNRLLKAVSDHLDTAFFSPLLLGRLGADRFVCVVDATKVTEESLTPFCQYEYTRGEKSITITMSCGIYPIRDTGETIELICDKAAMIIRFIRIGQNKYVATFDETIEQSFSEETRILTDVELAILNQHFEPYYQPIVDCRTGEIASAEALARWIHPTKGILSPSTFIPILEQKEMIPALDSIIISKVDRLVKSRLKKGLPVIPISVNLSRVDLFNSSFLDSLHTMLRGKESIQSLCRFEVTESALISLPDSVFDILSSLRADGASVFVDDFGNGYSSLGMISDFDFDMIKLDKQFSDHISTSEKSRSIMKAVIDLAHNLNAKVVAEGVETEEQLTFLRECGCDYVQGFYFYHPMSESDFSALLDKQKQ